MSHADNERRPATNCAGHSHLCFQVSGIHAAYERLREAGVRFRSAPGNNDFDVWFVLEGA
jgi:4-hydroxyphenylpyruvate dioxygenase-like putative hemolysin